MNVTNEHRKSGFWDRLSRPDPVLLVILAVAAVLIFYQLGQRPFWQDEAETACLARSVLKYGYPKAFDGVNLISQEEGREFNQGDYLWRWSPWLQIYVSAAAFGVGGFSTAVGRFPFALAGLVCVWLVYHLIKRRFDDPNWARLSAALLALSVPFILYARQGRYYSLGALLVLVSLWAFRGKWQTRTWPAALLAGSMVLLFYANYVLFLSYAAPLAVAALIMYHRELAWGRAIKLGVIVLILVLPGLLLSKAGDQAGLLNLSSFRNGMDQYLTDHFQFMVPLPIALYLLWRWRGFIFKRTGLAGSDKERFVFFLVLVIIGNIIILSLIPQRFNRYLAHLYPLCTIILGWVVLLVWRYQKFAGVLLGLLLALTNWLHILPMNQLSLSNRPENTDFRMLTQANVPLRLYLKELTSGGQDVNQCLIHFFQTEARAGETVVVTYGDLPLQFYTDCRVLGGLQSRLPPPGELPDWVVKRPFISLNRQERLFDSVDYVLNTLDLDKDYEAIVLPCPDERFGNRADPYNHRFFPVEGPFRHLTIYRKKAEAPGT